MFAPPAGALHPRRSHDSAEVYPTPLLNLIRTTTAGFNIVSSLTGRKKTAECTAVALVSYRDIGQPDQTMMAP
jgi:hypothetical protein